ncbi:MAG: hypothetical protein ALAOOOJD_00962 [bacterium]|nr:hypothetical protein [bacterium]
MICKICENTEENQIFTVREMMFGFREEFLYFQCARCDCLQIAEFPANLAKYYPPAYYSYAELPPRSSNNPIHRTCKKIRDHYAIFGKGAWGRMLHACFPNKHVQNSLLSEVDGLNKRARILDVGSGSGSLLYALQENGFTRLLGIDPFLDQNIEYENGLKILKKTVHEVEEEWDVVMFHHTFEHLPDPTETLQSVAARLAPGGTCLIRIPTVSSFAWKHYGVNWVQLDAPRHLFLHSIESIKIIAQKANLCLQRIIYDSTAFQFWGSEQYRKDIPLMSEQSYAVNQSRSILSNREMAKFEQEAQRLNSEHRGDSAAFYLTKPA